MTNRKCTISTFHVYKNDSTKFKNDISYNENIQIRNQILMYVKEIKNQGYLSFDIYLPNTFLNYPFCSINSIITTSHIHILLLFYSLLFTQNLLSFK